MDGYVCVCGGVWSCIWYAGFVHISVSECDACGVFVFLVTFIDYTADIRQFDSMSHYLGVSCEYFRGSYVGVNLDTLNKRYVVVPLIFQYDLSSELKHGSSQAH